VVLKDFPKYLKLAPLKYAKIVVHNPSLRTRTKSLPQKRQSLLNISCSTKIDFFNKLDFPRQIPPPPPHQKKNHFHFWWGLCNPDARFSDFRGPKLSNCPIGASHRIENFKRAFIRPKHQVFIATLSECLRVLKKRVWTNIFVYMLLTYTENQVTIKKILVFF